MVGRRISLTLTFDVQPSLCVASSSFLEHYCPTINGQRAPGVRPPDPRALSASLASPLPAGAARRHSGDGGLYGSHDGGPEGDDGYKFLADFSTGTVSSRVQAATIQSGP